MKIAGVYVNEKCLPTKDVFIKIALTTKRFYKKKDGLKLIEEEINKSGLYKKHTKKPKRRGNSVLKNNNGLNNNKQP